MSAYLSSGLLCVCRAHGARGHCTEIHQKCEMTANDVDAIQYLK